MSHSGNKVPLGAVLQQAGLVSAVQVKQALKQQSQVGNNQRIGEILAAQGYIKPQTAEFFAEYWSNLIQEDPKQPIGQYLKQAALLNEQQIQVILDEQKKTQVKSLGGHQPETSSNGSKQPLPPGLINSPLRSLKFGELAIAKNWLKQTTIDFFLRYLAAESRNPKDSLDIDSSMQEGNNAGLATEKIELSSMDKLEYAQRVHQDFLKIKLKLLKLEGKDDYSEQVLEKVLLWTGGQSFLTRKLFQLISENRNSIVPGKQAEQIDDLVKNKLLSNWAEQELGGHLKTIENRLLDNQQWEPSKLLQVYQQILTEAVSLDQSKEQQELLKIGLVVKQPEKLSVANLVYKSVFNQSWVERELNKLTENDTIPEVVPVSQAVSKSQERFFKPRNLFLLLALIGLLTVLINNIAKEIAVRASFDKGNKLLQQKSFEQAIAEYNRLLNIDSNYFQAWTNRGYALAGLQKYEEMRQSCSTATIIEPKAVYAWNCQGEALHNLKREEEALVAFDRAIALNPQDGIFLINKSESLQALGKNDQSFTVIKDAIQVLEQMEARQGKQIVQGEFAIALTFLGNGYRKKEQYQAAVDNYNRALGYSPSYFPAQIGKGIVLNRINRHQQAREEFEQILDNPQLTEAKQAQTWFYLGKTLCASGQNFEGIAAFEEAIKLRSDYEAAETAQQKCQ